MRTPVVIDTDPGADDAVAITYLAAHPEVELVGVGTVHGNVSATVGAANALRILERAGCAEVPVAIGAEVPLCGELPWLSGQLVHGGDGLAGNAGAEAVAGPSQESAAQQLVRLAHAHPGQLRLVSLAPLTNVALALQIEPKLPSLLRSMTWMGGAIEHPGNVAFRAEANSWHDPEAADQVLAAGLPLTVVPLDVTEDAWAGEEWFDRLARVGSPAARSLGSWTEQYVRSYTAAQGTERGERGCVLHDPVAAVVALQPTLARIERVQVVVECLGHARGATWVERRRAVFPGTELPARPEVGVALGADHAAILETVLRTIAGTSP